MPPPRRRDAQPLDTRRSRSSTLTSVEHASSPSSSSASCLPSGSRGCDDVDGSSSTQSRPPPSSSAPHRHCSGVQRCDVAPQRGSSNHNAGMIRRTSAAREGLPRFAHWWRPRSGPGRGPRRPTRSTRPTSLLTSAIFVFVIVSAAIFSTPVTYAAPTAASAAVAADAPLDELEGLVDNGTAPAHDSSSSAAPPDSSSGRGGELITELAFQLPKRNSKMQAVITEESWEDYLDFKSKHPAAEKWRLKCIIQSWTGQSPCNYRQQGEGLWKALACIRLPALRDAHQHGPGRCPKELRPDLSSESP